MNHQDHENFEKSMNMNENEPTQPVSTNRNLPNNSTPEGATQPIPVIMQQNNPPANPNSPALFPDIVIQEPSNKKRKKSGKGWKRLLLIIGGLLIVLLLGGGGAYLGYNSAIDVRKNTANKELVKVVVTQFQMGLADQQAGNYTTARQRFEYVIRLDPKFPGAAQKLAEVMLAMATQSVPTVELTPTPSPTPDNRNIDEKWAGAVNLYKSQDWDGIVDTLMSLRKTDQSFKAVEIDGMLYTALRQRGVKKIVSGQLEPGIYDLALAERFAPLDREAEGVRNMARLYLIGASFWGVDWGQAYDYFKQIAPGNPGMVDGSGYTAGQRFAISAAKYADTIYAKGDYCTARDYYSQAMSSNIQGISATATKAAYDCAPPTAQVTASPTGGMTPTPTLTGAVVATTAVPTVATTEAPAATATIETAPTATEATVVTTP